MSKKSRRHSKEDARLTAEVASTMTLSELAAAFSVMTPDVTVGANTQRLRHWVREEAVRPSEFEHAGRGKHRQFGPEAKYQAAVLHVMTSSGLPVAYSTYIPDAMRIVSSHAAKWIAARQKGKTLALPPLIIGTTIAANAQVGVGNLKDAGGFKVADVALTIEINLTKIFSELDHGH